MADSIQMTDEEKRLVTVQPLTAAGNPAEVDGAVTFVITAGTCTVQQVDELNAYVISGDDPGISTLNMQCDADLGSGVTHITDTMQITVTSASAASLDVTVGAPELK